MSVPTDDQARDEEAAADEVVSAPVSEDPGAEVEPEAEGPAPAAEEAPAAPAENPAAEAEAKPEDVKQPADDDDDSAAAV